MIDCTTQVQKVPPTPTTLQTLALIRATATANKMSALDPGSHHQPRGPKIYEGIRQNVLGQD